MFKNAKIWVAIAALAGGSIAGCTQDYNQERPPVGNLDPDNAGLQAKDVVAASDMLSASLLSDPALNKSATQWTLGVDEADMKDETTDRLFSTNYAIFLARLAVNIQNQGQGRVELIEDPQRVAELRARESGTPEFGQGGGTPSGFVGPGYVLYGTAYDMPNLATNYYMLVFKVVELRTGKIAWQKQYEVQVAR
jgi:hypothetical protein